MGRRGTKTLTPSAKRPKTHFLNRPAVYRLGTKWAGHLPMPFAYAIADAAAGVSLLLYPRALKNTIENLRMVLQGESQGSLAASARKLFRNYARYLVDYAMFAFLPEDEILKKIVSFEGKDILDAAVNQGKGIILLTAHMGNWELGGLFLNSLGLSINVLTNRDENPGVDEARTRYRQRHGIKTITVGVSTPLSSVELAGALFRGEVVAMLIDRHNPLMGNIEIEFFGKKADFPAGPFILSKMTGAPIITGFVVMEKDGYKGIIEGPFTVNNDIDGAARKAIESLQRNIAKYPCQWYNFDMGGAGSLGHGIATLTESTI
ncbi:lysophospholipid acyltransferase family protein [Candidatus Magnetominusculus dajiuhuensis]|uniref:lysophospholipid acyltransferase family protein n=1 Tax=Candidatus Magnetominusculus dajiuhuensis TaxID=3137712 RepID=UPI003B438F32